nr:hypothetical protein [Lachnospiraceae bacterium]
GELGLETTIYATDDKELNTFAESMADSLTDLYNKTGYKNITLKNTKGYTFSYKNGYKDTREELTDSILWSVNINRKKNNIK